MTVTLPGDERLQQNLLALRDGDRITVKGGLIRNRLHVTTCSYCGMGLVDDMEYHPYAACEAYQRTHDSREVWREIRRLAQQGEPT